MTLKRRRDPVTRWSQGPARGTRAMGWCPPLLVGLGLCWILLGCATVRQALEPRADAGAQSRVPGGSRVAPKRLIEFGGDEPDTAFMRRHIAQMERAPFDGCVFYITYTNPDGTTGPFLWEVWGSRAFTEGELQPALAELRATPFDRFTHNFLRFNTTPGDVDWFDDFAPILNNARLAAWIARQGKARGILFDVEQYQTPLFSYRSQRDAGTRSWDEYAGQARRRGREVMEAFQAGYPDLTLFLTFGYSVPWRETQGGGKALADAEYGLLAPFLDGMVDAARGQTRLVDGYELAYFHDKDTSAFATAYRTVTEELLPIVADPRKYGRLISVSFGLWMDFESSSRGWDGVDGSRNFYTPEEFERSVRAALEVADEYVWVYTEVPRWWSSAGGPVNLPEAYAEALRRARQGLAP